MRLIEGHWYRFNDRSEHHTGYYVGKMTARCEVSGEDTKCFVFNVWSGQPGTYSYDPMAYSDYCKPEIIEDLGVHNGIILDGCRKPIHEMERHATMPMHISEVTSYANCIICSNRNFTSNTQIGKKVRKIYNLHLGSANIELCPRCLYNLREEITSFLDKEFAHESLKELMGE